MNLYDIENYDYELPPELIAQVPARRRDESRLLVVERKKGTLKEALFHELPDLLTPGDLLVLNDTRVIAARLYGRKGTGGAVEILILGGVSLDQGGGRRRYCLLRSSKPPRVGTVIYFGEGLKARVEEVLGGGIVRLYFAGERPLEEYISKMGCTPLPPYIRREGSGDLEEMDRDRYQTVYARVPGAVAAPTAGLHFTEQLLERLDSKGIETCRITLHVGYGTFQPVRVSDIREHNLMAESYNIPADSASAVNRAKGEGRRVVAVGTTVVRTLESSALESGSVKAGEGQTDLVVRPGFPFSIVGGLITNFHLPRSSLLFLVSAFAGLKLIKEAYAYAVRERFRFFSYGDAMLIL
jgi:S-adenosylmethionine:tRNA ribosyltransferase-isomerase